VTPAAVRARVRAFALPLLLVALAPVAGATPSFDPAQPWNAVTTFQSIGLYWKPANGTGQQAAVRFRQAGSTKWREGLDLWYDARNAEYRGSLVELDSGTSYEIQLKLGAGAWTNTAASCNTASANECNVPASAACDSSNQTQCTRTWSDSFPVGFSISLPSGTTKVVINAPSAISRPHGKLADGTFTIDVPNAVSGQSYLLVSAAPGVEIDQSGIPANANATLNPPCIELKAGSRYLILRGLVLKNCRGDGITIFRPNVSPATITPLTHHIVIEDSDISGWGGTIPGAADGWPNKAVNCNYWTAKGTYNPNENRPSQIVIQRTRMYNPRHTARNWNFGHPQGPSAVGFERCGQNHVIRYNEIFSTSANRFMDGLSGAENLGEEGSQGFPWADSDIYGNRISQAQDDAIEAEGANRNVRIWKNFTERTAVAVANATVGVGPIYVWRNVSGKTQGVKPFVNDPGRVDSEDRGPFVKAGGPASFTGGRAYYFHNTVLQAPPPSPFASGLGLGGGIRNSACRGCLVYNFVSLNNIWHTWKDNWESILASGLTPSQQATIVADHDLYNAPVAGAANPEPNGARFSNTGLGPKPTYAASNSTYPGDPAMPSAANGNKGDFRLKPGTLGHGAHAKHAVRINNFNDLDNGDIGAHQSGPDSTLMQFGVAAAPPVAPSTRR